MDSGTFFRRVGLFAVAPLALWARPAEACGGLFCDGQNPVLQTGESIIFAVDEDTRTVDVIVNILYQGAAADFAWILPLQSPPKAPLQVGPSWAFTVADALTAPRFLPTLEQDGECTWPRFVDHGGVDYDLGSTPVDVLARAPVGPYESVILDARDPEAVRRWLLDNQFAVTDPMIRAVAPYLEKGDVLLALKLRKDNDVGDIAPIWVTMDGTEACVPLRLTAIAALADMDVTALVLSKSGRAIPVNYLHVELNLAKLNWFQRGANYRQLVAEAVDEGAGHAFTTEFYGPAAIFAGKIDSARWDFERLAKAQAGPFQTLLSEMVQDPTALKDPSYDFDDPVQRLRTAGMSRRELAAIVRRARTSTTGGFDAAWAAAEIQARVAEPERRVQALFDRFPHVTRLYTRLSPEEMTVDPIFAFRADLPEVSNVHGARILQRCGGPRRTAKLEVELEGGALLHFDSYFDRFDRSHLDSMPAAARIERLAEGLLVADNTAAIAEAVERHNVANGACGCRSTPAGAAWPGLLFALLFALRPRAGRAAAG